MGFSNWICTNSTKNMFVKIVHPGGHVELHDRPILAAEIFHRNPRCVVAHPHVFQKPWAIVAPETELMPGQKFYVVPVSTIRKLQRHSKKYSPGLSPVCQTPTSQSQKSEEPEPDSDNSSICWFFMNKNKTQYSAINQNLDDESESANSADSNAGKGVDMEKDESCFSDKNCFKSMISGVKSTNCKGDGDDSEEKTRSSSNLIALRKRNRASCDSWQPNLESINESEE